MKYFNEKIKSMDVWDVALIKLAVAVFVLFVITIWPAAMTWVHSVNPWYFFAAFVIFFVRPFYRICVK